MHRSSLFTADGTQVMHILQFQLLDIQTFNVQYMYSMFHLFRVYDSYGQAELKKGIFAFIPLIKYTIFCC
jgi:hypothetical protein